jgi:hypothetical protein
MTKQHYQMDIQLCAGKNKRRKRKEMAQESWMEPEGNLVPG